MEKKEKEDLNRLIEEMEKKLLHGGHGIDDMSAQQQEQIRKERLLQK